MLSHSVLRDMSWHFILDNDISRLPVRPSELARRHGWQLITRDQYASDTQQTVDRINALYDGRSFSLWSEAYRGNVIVYNPSAGNSALRWAVMHEIAHIILGHISPQVPTLLSLPHAERADFDRDADGIARRVLCPSIVLHRCGATSVASIRSLCGISTAAAQHRADYMATLTARNMWRSHPLERVVEAQFEGFIREYTVERG